MYSSICANIAQCRWLHAPEHIETDTQGKVNEDPIWSWATIWRPKLTSMPVKTKIAYLFIMLTVTVKFLASGSIPHSYACAHNSHSFHSNTSMSNNLHLAHMLLSSKCVGVKVKSLDRLLKICLLNISSWYKLINLLKISLPQKYPAIQYSYMFGCNTITMSSSQAIMEYAQLHTH